MVPQLFQTYKVTAEVDPQLNWLLLAIFLGCIVVALLVGILWLPPWWMWLLLGFMAGVTGALYLLLDRAKKATFTRYAGQPGSAEVALSMLDKKKWFYSPVITATRQLDVVHRAVGPGGIVLIGEGARVPGQEPAGHRGQEARAGRVRRRRDHHRDG